MALVEGCKHEIEITVPASEVERETERVIADLQKKVRLPGFRPGKAPVGLIRSRFESDIRQDVLDRILPRYFNKKVEEDHLQVVGSPRVTDVHFEKGEPLTFKAEFEVAPEFELGEYRGIEVPYQEPVVTDEDVNQRIEQLREQRAEYVNLDPRPIEDGDYAVIALKSTGGIQPPIEQDELVLHIGDEETLAGFTENLRGLSPGDEKDFEITYPEDYGQERLAGKTIRFHGTVKAIRRKELPELNDDFAKDLGDYQNLDELRDAVRKAIFRDREMRAQQEAKEKIVDKLVEAHNFPVPEAYIDRQIETQVENQLRGLAASGVDPRQLKLDWEKVRASQRDRAIHNVKGSLLLDRIADREAIVVTQDELDHEVQRIARQRREPVAAVRMQLEKEGAIRRIASHIRTEKTLNFLFEQARKVAPAE
ncbi:MAG TPA: trigger factor [Bryobacteraceae bacterium]|nr:trigger factor [Bryobacteraceae bacterium]